VTNIGARPGVAEAPRTEGRRRKGEDAAPQGGAESGRPASSARKAREDPDAELVESHLLDAAVSLYGQTVEVTFLERLRDEERFADREALAARIATDAASARAWHAAHPLPA
jgi:hypothetical protein